MRFLCRIFLFLLPVCQSMAQHRVTGFLGIEQGLSNNSVTCIHRDKQGFMWFGTYDGLNRYDGYTVRTFRNRLQDSNSLVYNRITTVGEDSLGNIWIGTKRGLCRYNDRSGLFSAVQFIPYAGGKPQQLAGEVYGLSTCRNGRVLAGTADRGLLAGGNGDGHLRQVPMLAGKPVTDYSVVAVTEDRRSNIWLFVGNTGLCRYDAANGSVLPVNGDIHAANCLFADRKGNLWAGTDDGLYRYDEAGNKWESFGAAADCSDSKVISLTMDHEEQLWISTDGNGVFVLPLNGGKPFAMKAGNDADMLTSNAVYAVYEDKEQRKWIGTLRGGVNIIDRQKVRFRTVGHLPNANSLVDNFTFSFCEDGNEALWIGTDGGGISRWNRRTDAWEHFAHRPGNPGSLSNNNVTSIVRDGKGQIWAATFGGGINRFDRSRRAFVHYRCVNGAEDRFVWKLFIDSKGVLWAGACMEGALYRYDPQADRFEIFDPSLRNVLTIYEDRAGQLWAGSYASLVKVNGSGRNHKAFNLNLVVRSMYEDESGQFWVGTEEGGLLRFNRESGAYIQITEKDGLPGNAILNMLADNKGNLWMSTYNGIARYGTKDGRIRKFFASDGLQSNQFNYNAALRLAGGEMLFGGIEGFNIFHPDSITENHAFPALRITGLRVSNEVARVADTLVLPYDKAMFSLDYVALEYSAPDKIAYAYLLEGWDEDWNFARQLRTANYSRLKEGNYILRMKNTNADGVWNPEERVIFIKVLPPWYRTWWAYTVYGLLAAGMLYLYRSYQRRKARLHYEIELSRLRMEKEKELNERKLTFFTNISHEFRTPLTLIINPVKELLYSDGRNIESKDLTIVYRNARRLLSLVDQLLLFRKAGHEEDALTIVPIQIGDLCREVFLCFSHQAELKKFRFDFSVEGELPVIYGDREKLEVAIFNLLSNAFKYTPDEGAVAVSVYMESGMVCIRVKDTGCGISGEIGDKLFDCFYQQRTREARRNGFGIGLYLVKKFVTGHGGDVSYSSAPAGGSAFTIRLLAGTAHLPNHPLPAPEEVPQESSILETLSADDDLLQDTLEAEENAAEDSLEVLLSAQPAMLVVDDNEQMRQYIRAIFRSGFTVYEAGNGSEGLALASRHLPDIIVSDVLMDGLNGIEFCQQIKQDPALAHIPVVLLTGSASPEIKLKGIEGGAEDYISKPFDKDLFIARISNIIRSRNVLQRYFYSEITGSTGSQKVPAEYKEFLNRCIRIAEKHLLNPDFNIRLFAQEVGISHSSLYKKVKSISGRSVNEFIRLIRLRKAAELLITTECNISEAAYQVGFNDLKYFREQFVKVFDMTPSKYVGKYRRKFDKNHGSPA